MPRRSVDLQADGRLREPPIRKLSMSGKALNCVLGVVIVPRNAIVIEKREQPAAVFVESSLVTPRDLGWRLP
jgi:hypothetical protein